MSYTKREYRTNLSMQGLIFLDRKELRCTIKDLSTNGIKIELKPVNYFNDVQAFSKVIIIDDIVNFAIPEMYLDGEAKIIRKEIDEDRIYVSLAFANVFFGLEHVPYKREYYRTLSNIVGQIKVHEQIFEVSCQNVSLTGMLIVSNNQLDISLSDVIEVSFDVINIHGNAQQIWSRNLKEQYLIGIKFTQLLKPIKGIAAFNR